MVSLEKEIWKDVKDYESYYQVSNLGRVKSLERWKQNHSKLQKVPEKILHYNIRGTKKKGFNALIRLEKNNTIKSIGVARLVYSTFYNIDLTENDVIFHIDKNPLNCRLDNLKLKKKNIKKFEYYGEYLDIWELCKKTNINKNTIYSRICRLKWNAYETLEIPAAIYNKRKDRKVNEK